MLPPHPFFHVAMVAPDLFGVLDFANLSLLLFKLFSEFRLLAQKVVAVSRAERSCESKRSEGR
jgi:hypothetical protein